MARLNKAQKDAINWFKHNGGEAQGVYEWSAVMAKSGSIYYAKRSFFEAMPDHFEFFGGANNKQSVRLKVKEAE